MSLLDDLLAGRKPPANSTNHVNHSPRRRARGFRPPSIGRLEAALRELTNELFAHRHRRAATGGSRLRYITLDQLMATPEPVLAACDLVDNPIDDAIRAKIKEIGGYLAARLTFDELLQLVERVSNDGSNDAERRFYLIEKCFDGLVTRDGAHWCA